MPVEGQKQMANTVTKAVLYTEILDGVLAAGLTSAPLTADENRVRYSGGGTVEIAKLSTSGFGDYSRSSGYPDGSATLAWEAHTISMDRGVKFTVDVMDQDETMQTLSATNLISEFTRTQSIPEVDSYRYSKIFQAIVNDSTARFEYYTLDASTVLGKLQGNIADIQDVIGEQEPLICFISGEAFKYLTQSSQLSKQLGVQNVTGANGITTKIYDVDGVQLVPVPSARMKTEYAFSATNGYSAKPWAMGMNWIVMAKSAGVAFTKHNKLKVFGADVNQAADGELIQARMYHDLWVYENKHNGIFISLKTATIAGFSAAELLTASATNVTYTIATYASRDTGHKFYYYDGGKATDFTAPAAYAVFDTTGYTEIVSATAVADVVSSGYYGALVELDENGRAVRFESIKASA